MTDRLIPVLGALLLALATAATAPTARAETAPYRVKAGDVLQISVWREADLQLEVLVRPDGGISMPLAGDLTAQGLTIAELRSDIAGRLDRFIPEAEVSVAVKEIRGNTFYVLGKVERPGEFVIHRELDVAQGLSMAGGTTTFAKLNNIIVLRREGEGQVVLPFRYPEVERGENLGQNIRLRSGDVIVVP